MLLAELKELWSSQRRSEAIEQVLQRWSDILAMPEESGWVAGVLRSSGLPAEAVAVEHAAARLRSRPDDWATLIGNLLRSGDPWWARQLLDECPVDSPELRALRIEAELRGGEAAPWIERWIADRPAMEADPIAWWIQAGRLDRAEELLAHAPATDLWRVRFALWRNQTKTARGLLDSLPPRDEVRCLAAVADVLDGRYEQAETELRKLLDGDARDEANLWLATTLRHLGRFDEAQRRIDVVRARSDVFRFAALLERDLIGELQRQEIAGRRYPAWLQRITRPFGWLPVKPRRVAELEYADVLYPLGLRPQESVIDALAGLLERLAGNHSDSPTLLQDGRLRPLRVDQGPRHLGASAQAVLWTRGIGGALELFQRLAEGCGGHPLFRIYQGELELWAGNYAAAEGIFRAALERERTTRWAWIGFGASRMLQGDLEGAQSAWSRGLKLVHPGPTLFVYRGECFRRQGKTAAARADLETALQQKPQRLSARINLALLDRSPAALREVESECAAGMPFLLQELEGDVVARLEGVLQAMRGNRSSSRDLVSYHLWGRVWRCLPGTLDGARSEKVSQLA